MALLETQPSKGSENKLRLALPSDGEMYRSTLEFLQHCGLDVKRDGPRRYTGELAGFHDVMILFQRAADISAKVEEGTADFGIVGLDRYMEFHQEAGDTVIIIDDLGYSRCELTFAVPESWVDVNSMADLADLAVEFHEDGRELRIATKYPMLVERFLYAQSIYYFSLISASGALEAGPAMGYADLIADLMATGVTLQENNLKTLNDGSVLTSQACLIGNRQTFSTDKDKLRQIKKPLEWMEAYIRAQDVYAITIGGPQVGKKNDEAGPRGGVPVKVVRGVSVDESSDYDIQDESIQTVLIEKQQLDDIIRIQRNSDANEIAVTPLAYLFKRECEAYNRLVKSIETSKNR
jgi:ATP phosphoribosyltransferase